MMRYCTREEIAVDWADIIPEAMILSLQRSCGKQQNGQRMGFTSSGTREHHVEQRVPKRSPSARCPKWIERTATPSQLRDAFA